MRAIGHAFVFVFLLAGHIDIAPSGSGRQNNCTGFQDTTVFHLHLNQTALFFSRNNFCCALQIHDVSTIVTHLGFHVCAKFRTISFQNRNVVFNGHGVVHLTAKTFCCHTHANAFACGIDGGCSASRATAHNQQIEVFFGIELCGFSVGRTRVNFGHNFFHQHAP